ncbi:unnamed protein product [Rhizoctonia solani]|uniref:Serine/threonine-protein phosphatase 2A activator n=1 Tax=Rhizoctonia solani TaxID=456999 RepID=A0A8H3HT93_9AGAM|nr:unnamed protein product [Rhizoctonia solani]
MEVQSSTFPRIPICDIEALGDVSTPRPMIQTDQDVQTWQRSKSYLHLLLYIRRLGESVVGTDLRTATRDGNDEGIEKGIGPILKLLEELESWLSEIPPQISPQRYGNLAFRDWGKRLQRCQVILESKLPSNLHKAIPLLKPYLLTSFGSFIRIDYGTGHELSFVVFLLCLHKLGFLADEPAVDKSTVLDIFVKYLHVCWKLQDTYKLEPAGSHGVWGLDDYSFLGYYWGSAQLKEKPNSSPTSVLQVPLPNQPSDLYTLSIARVKSIKSGPFHEHSPQLYSIASSVPVWSKVNSGLLKMYEAEVLSKRVVVQHLPLGEPLMPFSNHQPQGPTTFPITSPRHTPTQTSRITTASTLGAVNLLPPLRQGVRPSSSAMPGLTPLFAAPSGGAKITVSRAAARGNIPGAMGRREVEAPLGLTSMGPPTTPAKHGMTQPSAERNDEPNIENTGRPSDRENHVGEGEV